jgi:AcrR family transcriptional regulator
LVKNARSSRGADRRDRIVEAALESLKTNGYKGTSTRSIAAIGGFNPALIFYYFDNLNDLLVAALEQTNGLRLDRYRDAVQLSTSLPELLDVLRRLYEDDIASGHIRVVSELVAGSVSDPELGDRVVALMQPWIELAELGISKALDGSPALELVSARELALAAVTFYLGANLVAHLGPGADEVRRLLDSATMLAPLVDRLGGSSRRRS